jgi:hypothetical protein
MVCELFIDQTNHVKGTADFVAIFGGAHYSYGTGVSLNFLWWKKQRFTAEGRFSSIAGRP